MKGVNPFKWLLIPLAVLILSGNVFGLTELKKIVKPGTHFTGAIPQVQYFGVEAFSETDNVWRMYQYQVRVSPKTRGLDLEYQGDGFTGEAHYTGELQFINLEFIYTNQDLIKKNGYERVTVTVAPDQSHKKVAYYLSGKVKETKDVAFTTEAFEKTVLGYLLQSMLNKGFNGFNANVDLGKMALNMDFNLVDSANILTRASGYELPDKFKTFAKASGPVKVYTIKPTGMVGLFFQNKFYYAFEQKPPFRPLAYWGGPQNEAEFQIFRVQSEKGKK